MRFISVLLLIFLIHLSSCRWWADTDTTTAQVVLDSEEEDEYGAKQNLQIDPESDLDEDQEPNGHNNDFHNQEDDTDPDHNNETPTDVSEPSPPIAPQPNGDQNRGLPGGAETPPAPDYSINRGYPTGCQGGQYQCQKRDPTAPTRCIPPEWRCNGLRDCEENDDESSCSPNQLSRGRSNAKCSADQYQCHGSGINSVPPHCIERRFVCDGTYQCSYGDDEANCERRDRERDRDERREPPNYPNQNQIPRRNENIPTNDQNNGNRGQDSREGYRPQTQTNDRKSEEYVQRLEWRDRCFRSCLKY